MVKRAPKSTVLALAATLAFALSCGSASAAPGDLTFGSCVADTNATACSVPSQPVLTDPGGIAVSPDGTSVYVVSRAESAVSHFLRAADGTLDFRGCVADTNVAGCTVPAAQRLQGAIDVEVSPDGQSVYVAALDDSAVTEFSRSPNGSLTFRNCYSENAANGCLEPGGSATLGLSDVEVSPDGQSVYAVAAIDSGITHFSRDTTGKLQFRTCVTAEATGGCVAPLPALAAVVLIALSPDGQSAYATSAGAEALSHLSRSPTTGVLTFQACFAKTNADGCAVPTPAPLTRPSGLAVSPDGSSVYVTSPEDGAITQFVRGAGGFLVPQGCVADTAATGCRVPAQPALAGVSAVAVSPDGAQAYALAGEDSAITAFSRATSGDLTFQSCLADAGAAGCPIPLRPSIGRPVTVALSPDGSSLYATSQDDDAVTHFRREPPAVTPPSDPPGATPDTAAPDTSAGKGPKRKVKTRKRRAKVSLRVRRVGTRHDVRVPARRPCREPLLEPDDREGQSQAQGQEAHLPGRRDRRGR